MSDWQPIESAPKDGTWVLIRGGTADPYYWYGTDDEPPCVCAKWLQGDGGGGWFFADWDGALRSQWLSPTEWMRVPA